LVNYWFLSPKNIYREPGILQLLIIFTRCLEERLIIKVSIKIISFARKSKGLDQITADPNKTLAIFDAYTITEVRLSLIYKTGCPFFFLHPRQLRVLDGGVDLHGAHPTTCRHVSHDKFRVQMDFYQKIQTFSWKPDPITHFTGVLDQPVCSKFTFHFSTNTWDPYITCSDLISKHIHLLVFGWKHAKPHGECCGVNKLIHDEALNGEQVKFVRTQQRRSSMLFVQCTQETWCHCTNMETPTSIGEFNSVLQRHSLGD